MIENAAERDQPTVTRSEYGNDTGFAAEAGAEQSTSGGAGTAEPANGPGTGGSANGTGEPAYEPGTGEPAQGARTGALAPTDDETGAVELDAVGTGAVETEDG